ncbi:MULTISPECIES: hypothetical protein [unclassified Ensifer]|uniref:DUF6929 family protein n=1 Tax=unclassified Ensifer TaxID=2633371 RepID=UPI000812F47A|nr:MULTISPECIES: hypothetical protein [unclassified Ensifer]OCP06317.1 hypothetical protein BBX50_23345 [Ensifer sp. LC11]OCP09077.1 hypothetical protein BC374_20210 [Ensifer sp. LC13]OCP09860.1 hypothetical protein BC362_08985 [Ensifer sp. LC14]OCP31575.1 hypothetical protein BC364_23195 [Ensifer sp. LC499]
MIKLDKLRDLDIDASHSRRSYVSAASGLVCLDAGLCVIADDDLHLGVFPVDNSGPGHLVRLFEGVLPASSAGRKSKKPDLEALTVIPPCAGFSFGALLAIGSGSRPNRKRGALLGLDRSGALAVPPKSVDLSFLFDPIEGEFAQLNIEGAVVTRGELRLFQRANRRQNDSAIIRYSLASVLDALEKDQSERVVPIAIQHVDLGAVRGVPLGFTDAASLPNGNMIFSAVAESTDDAYLDGPCLGAGIGIIGDGGNLLSFDFLAIPHKIEGIHASQRGDLLDLLLVTDADNADVPAGLFSGRIRR